MEVASISQRLVPQSVTPSTITRGRIRTAQAIDREDMDIYQLTLIAQDQSDSPLSASIPIMISVLDTNDNQPMFAQPSWNFTVTENTNNVLIMEFNVRVIGVRTCQKSTELSCSLILQVTDEDEGINSEIDFNLDASVRDDFSLMLTGPLSVELFLTVPLDREVAASHQFSLFAIDRGVPPLIGQTEIIVYVLVSAHSCGEHYH